MAEYSFIRLEESEGRVDIVLSHPPLNVLNTKMMRELIVAFSEMANRKELRVVVLRSDQKVFSAGVDVREHTPLTIKELVTQYSKVFQKLWELPVITIAAVNGVATAGGAELAIGCDLVVASEKAVFSQPEINHGVFPPMAAVVYPKLIGRNRAFELLLSGDDYTAHAAEKFGLVNKVFSNENFENELNNYATKFVNHSAASIAMTKFAMDKTMDKPARDGMAVVDAIYVNRLMKTNDAIEGLNAFLEKRDPKWQHK